MITHPSLRHGRAGLRRSSSLRIITHRQVTLAEPLPNMYDIYCQFLSLFQPVFPSFWQAPPGFRLRQGYHPLEPNVTLLLNACIPARFCSLPRHFVQLQATMAFRRPDVQVFYSSKVRRAPPTLHSAFDTPIRNDALRMSGEGRSSVSPPFGAFPCDCAESCGRGKPSARHLRCLYLCWQATER
jgi:hypothetical protein